MGNHSPRLPEQIYELICGNLALEEIVLPDRGKICSEFHEGSVCECAYQRMLAAYSRVCARLGVEE